MLPMDSPPESANASTATASGGSKPTSSAAAAATSDSPPVQESPFSNYVRKLSPIESVKVSNAVQQGFLGINSPPLVFTSPHLQPRETSFLQSLGEQVCEDEERSKEFVDISCNVDRPSSIIWNPLLTDTDKDAKTPGRDPPSSSSVCIDEYLSEPLEVECANSINSASAERKQVNDALQLSISDSSDPKEVVSEANEVLEIGNAVEKLQMLEQRMSYKQDKEKPQGLLVSEIEQEKVRKEQNDGQLSSECPSAEGDSLYHATNKEQARMAVAQVHEKPNDSSNKMHVISIGPARNVMQHDPEASHLHRSLSRRCLQFEAELLPPCLVKTPPAVSRPSGIGLHLNRIVSTSPLGHKATATIKGGLGWDNQIMEKGESSSCSPSMVECSSFTTGERAVKDEAKVVEPFGEIEALNVLQSLDATPLNKRKPDLDFTNSFEGHNQANPKKKRKKSSNSDSDGCKRCNCKKTKCLKLYCDCFAAGIYCADPCSCQGCFNRLEYEDLVLETRQQIESRNPFAFAPKIVQDVTEFPATIGDDKSLVATSSVRHKRGCNCKKSMCLKKYCECYQGNVGCSHGCRCEGCQNRFGRKGEYGMTEDVVSPRARDGTLESSGNDKLDFVAIEKDLLHLDLYDQRNMTPLTPLLQFSDHGKDPSKSRLGRFVPSPESDPSMWPPYAKTLEYPSNDVVHETYKDLVSYSSDQPMHCDTQVMNQYSPRSEEIASIGDFRPSQNPSLPSASSKIRSWIPSCAGSGGRLLPTGSLLRQTSPMTPMAPSTEAKSRVLDDDTPDILKESTPSTFVKVTSPNKKRVTPPHGNLGSSSSVGLKSSRKFILKAVPSFPPLTPCMDSSKSSAQQKHQ